MKDPTVDIETITPAVAARWLAENHRNRNLSSRRVEEMASDMLRGQWTLNGESIKFDGPQGLLDGQHRLTAVVQSGVTIESVVVRGLPADTQETMDRGKRRTLADALAMRGETSVHSLAAAINWLIQYDRGEVLQLPRPVNVIDGLAYLEVHPGLRNLLPMVQPPAKRLRMATGQTWGCAYLFYNLDQVDCEMFFDLLATGENLNQNDAILRLREMLIRQIGSARRIRKQFLGAYVIKAWNLWRDGVEVKQLVYKGGGAHPEPFPTPH